MTSNLRKLIFFVLLLGVTCAAYQFMIRPANQKLAQKKAQVDKKTEKLNELKKATAESDDLAQQLEKLQQAIDVLESRLPPHSEIHKVLEQVTVIGQAQGLKPKTIQTLKQKENSGYIEQPLKMEFEGNFNAFYSFLLELEKLPRIMKIRQLELKKIKDHEGQIAASFTVSIFFQNKA